MTNKEIIDGLKYTMDMCLFDANTGEYDSKESLNDMTRITYDSCEGAIKALEAQPTGVDETYLSIKDAISELKAMREHIVGYMSVVGTTAYDMGIEALEAQPCIEDYPTCTECEHYDRDKHYCPRFCQVIKDALAEAQPKKGEWIVFRCGDTDTFKCSECGMRVVNPYQYCPMCGAEMSGGEEDAE